MASGFEKKEWKARISEFATRRFLSVVSQSPGSMTVEVSRSEGLVSQEGDAFSPENMNGLEQRISQAFASVDREMEEAKKSAGDGKRLVAAAITAKRVAASASDTFSVLAEKIGKIVLGSGNAVRSDVLSGKTFTNDDGVEYVGAMPNRGTLNWSGVNTSAAVSAGYYSGGTLDSRPAYNKGVADADGRANPASANYQAGYNAKILHKVKVGTASGKSTVIDCTSIPGYQNMTADNFVIENQTFQLSIRWDYDDSPSGGGTYRNSKEYENGKLTVVLPYYYTKNVWDEGTSYEGWRYLSLTCQADIYAFYAA